MPSWHDGSSSSSGSPYFLGDFSEADYAPETFVDPTFCGLATGSDERCRVHHIEPVKCVSFQGTNTGRRYYLCSVENQATNCGFHSWVDGEWPEQLQNALEKLWGMYHASNNARIEEKIQHAKFVQEIAADKTSLEKKYASLLDDIKRFSIEQEKNVMQANYKRIMSGAEDEIADLKREVAELKQVQRSQADVMRAKGVEWEAERQALKDERRKTEHHLFDLLKLSNANKDKLKRVRAICEEPTP